MIGMRVKYNSEMTGTVINENSTHAVIKFDTGSIFCVGKAGLIEKCMDDMSKDNLEKLKDTIAVKLRSEGITKEKYNKETAIKILDQCVGGGRMISIFELNESEVIAQLKSEQGKLF